MPGGVELEPPAGKLVAAADVHRKGLGPVLLGVNGDLVGRDHQRSLLRQRQGVAPVVAVGVGHNYEVGVYGLRANGGLRVVGQEGVYYHGGRGSCDQYRGVTKERDFCHSPSPPKKQTFVQLSV